MPPETSPRPLQNPRREILEGIGSLAPSRSLIPEPRPLALGEAEALERERQRLLQAGLADLETRVELEPYFAGDPIAQLGWELLGGMGSVDYIPGFSGDAYFTPTGVTQDLTAADRQVLQGLFGRDYIPENTVAISDTASDPAIMAHEFRHAGERALFPEIQGMSQERLAALFGSGSVAPYRALQGGRLGQQLREAAMETRDDPSVTWNPPGDALGPQRDPEFYRRFPEMIGQDVYRDLNYPPLTGMADTIQYLDVLAPSAQEGMRRYMAAMDPLAEASLREMGVPPRAEPRPLPEPERPGFWERLFGRREAEEYPDRVFGDLPGRY